MINDENINFFFKITKKVSFHFCVIKENIVFLTLLIIVAKN